MVQGAGYKAHGAGKKDVRRKAKRVLSTEY